MPDKRKGWKRQRGFSGSTDSSTGGQQGRHSHREAESSGQGPRTGYRAGGGGIGGTKRTRGTGDHFGNQQYYSHNTGIQQGGSMPPVSHASSSASSSSAGESNTPEPAVREIPGFYFDPERKKYFKITANHVHGSQHPFSQQSIKEKSEPKPVLDPIKQRQGGRRLPSATSHYGRLGWFLSDRQMGLAGNPRRQLCEMHSLLVKRWRKDNTHEPVPSGSAERYTQLLVDPVRQDLYLGTSYGSIYFRRPKHMGQEHAPTWSLMSLGENSELTSLHLTPENYRISTYLGVGGQPGALKVYKMLPDLDYSNSPVEPQMLVWTHTQRKANFWTSAVAGDKIVIGTDQQLYHAQGWKSGRAMGHNLWTGSDVFSLAIDPPEKNNLVFAGCRNGTVRVFDLNQPQIFAPSSSEQFSKDKKRVTRSLFTGIGHNESSVQCMRRVSDHVLVTAATNGEISMWDTRYVGGGHGGGSGSWSSSSPWWSSLSKSGGSGGAGAGSFGRPMLEIRSPIPNYFSKTAFDINSSETLLAAENIEGKLSLWSMSTGERVRDLEVGGKADCFKFTTDMSICAVVGDQVQDWSVGA